MKRDDENAARGADGLAPLPPEELYRVCDPDSLGFETTDELTEGDARLGQERLVSSIEFGMGMRRPGYHIFALGPRNTDKREIVSALLEERSAGEAVPPDLCYVHNFDEPHRPRLLVLPAGEGGEFARAMEGLRSEIESSLIAAFESEEYQARRSALRERTEEEHGRDFEQLQERAREKGLAVLQTPAGFGIAPLDEKGEIMGDEEIEALSDERREELEENSRELQTEIQGLLRTVPARKRKIRGQLRELDREMAAFAIDELFEGVRERFEEHEAVGSYLDQVRDDIVEHVVGILRELAARQEGGPQTPFPQSQEGENGPDGGIGGSAYLRRYRVNLLVDHAETEGAPVFYEDHPSYRNLVGRVEHRSRMGVLSTDFSLIRAGAFHRASGGYLVLDARAVLMEPFAWEALKRTLTTGYLKIESLGQNYSPISTGSLEPEPLECDVKVVLFGERRVYYLLCALDPEFSSLFKVEADFEDEVEWRFEGEGEGEGAAGAYPRYLAGIVRARGLRAFDRTGVARVVEEASRMAGDRERLTTVSMDIDDLLQQADHWAGAEGREQVTRADVERAIEEKERRSSRLRDRLQEQIVRETVFISTEGEAVGQINGIAVLSSGNLAFGRPSRITARVGLGKGEIVDIEREVEMGGPIHSKGVLILKGLLTERYARERPLSLRASLVFEQSYGGIDGDSASVAELLALLSAIGRVPLRQGLAVTGSVNQHGEVQAIGGVNEKIEGFFEVCRERGLTGDQGVVIPRANMKHLMLRSEVVEAAAEGRFRIHAVGRIEEAIELFTGVAAGEPDAEGRFPAGSVNGRVDAELQAMSERLQALARAAAPGVGGGAGENGGAVPEGAGDGRTLGGGHDGG